MSVQDLKDFGKKCAEDDAVRMKAKRCINDIDGLIKCASDYGFAVTKKDFEDLAEEAKKSNELSEEQLGQISGGIGGIPSMAAPLFSVGVITSLYGNPVVSSSVRKW